MTSAFSCIIHKRLMCLFIYEAMFTIGESRAISPSDDTELNNKHNKWLELFDFQAKLLWRTPTKIPRAEKTHREHRLAQQRRQHRDHKHAQRQRQNTTIRLQMEPMKRANTDYRRFKKRWRDQATLTVYSKIMFFDATIGSNSYTICTTETGRLSFRRRAKQLPLQRNIFEFTPRDLSLTPQM